VEQNKTCFGRRGTENEEVPLAFRTPLRTIVLHLHISVVSHIHVTDHLVCLIKLRQSVSFKSEDLLLTEYEAITEHGYPYILYSLYMRFYASNCCRMSLVGHAQGEGQEDEDALHVLD
jgi:hypothetical protein